MRTTFIGLLMAAITAGAWAQAPEGEMTLPEAEGDLQYLELLNAAQLTPEQLASLLELQASWQEVATLSPEVTAVLQEVALSVLQGSTVDQALGALGDRQQIVRVAQNNLQQTRQTLAGQLVDLLDTEGQRTELIWFTSPARNLENVVRMLEQARQAPEQQWIQMREQTGQAIANMCAQVDPGAGSELEDVYLLLDDAHLATEADFALQSPTLAYEWASALMPNHLQQLEDEEYQRSRLTDICNQLITHVHGQALVEAKLDATDGAAP